VRGATASRDSADTRFRQAAANANYVEIEDAEHEILMENDAIRARFWREFDAFVAARLAEPGRFSPPRTPPL